MGVSARKLSRNDPCWCGSGRKYKKCHMEEDRAAGIQRFAPREGEEAGHVPGEKAGPARRVPAGIPRPSYAGDGKRERGCKGVSILEGGELEIMRDTCRTARRVLDRGIEAVGPGVTTDEIDAVVHQACIDEGGYPSPLNYMGFPGSACISVNEVVCHGVPDARPLANGDIVNIDVTLFLNGFHGDCSETVAVGDIDADSRRLMGVTRECLRRGISSIRPGGHVRDIGCSIVPYVNQHGYSVERSYCGHGIGRCFHMDPQVLHYCARGRSPVMKPGMIFTVEPMINMGTFRHKVLEDGWTVVTADGKRSAQFEHTVLVTEKGAEILTVK
ncbi:MAG: type I methionyl aminopeptidase [Kiritimatiellia bacterium]